MNQQYEVILEKAWDDFTFFHNNIFPQSFTEHERYVGGKHLDNWCKMLQDKRYTCILAPRKHSKSITIYSWLLWQNMRNPKRNLEIMYLSYKKELASYHIKRYKDMKEINPLFHELKDMTFAGGIAKFRWPTGAKHIIEPEGILSFKRGRHPDIIILDDVLADPTTMLDLAVIEKINKRVFEEVLSMVKEGGEIKVIGTAQTPIDFFFKMKENPDFSWGEFPAVSNWKEKQVLWPEKFPYERLMHIKNFEIGEKGFQKEYMIQPVWSADSFFKRKHIDRCVNPKLQNMMKLTTKNKVGAGWDIGKHSHPAHFTVFEFVPIGKGLELAVQRYQLWMDGWDYTKQLDFIKPLVYNLRVDYCNYDNTRGELEGFYEKGYMDKSKFIPIIFNTKSKHAMASEFEKRVTYKVIKENGEEQHSPLIELMNHQRMLNQIMSVTNDLQAIQTHEGHGDSFFSISLALYQSRTGEMFFLQDKDNVTGLF